MISLKSREPKRSADAPSHRLSLSIGEKLALALALTLAPFAFMIWQFMESERLMRIASLESERLGVLVCALVVLLLCLALIVAMIERTVVRPLRLLAQSAGALLDGEAPRDMPRQTRGDEVGQIARSLSIFRDISALRMQAEAAREAAESASLAKSNFIASVSHELRTPLSAIIGYSEMIMEEAGGQLQDAQQKDLERILGAAHHLLSLINEILDLSKVEAGRTELMIDDIDPLTVLNDAAATLAPLAARNTTRVIIEPSEFMRTFGTDELKLRQCLLNLISNACKFTRGGEVRLSIDESKTQGARTLRFRVADTGIGMTPEQMRRLFQPFAQADNSIAREYGGTGLGLALTRRLAQLLGGDVSVTSQQGAGSTFTLWVREQAPRQAASPGVLEQSARHDEAPEAPIGPMLMSRRLGEAAA